MAEKMKFSFSYICVFLILCLWSEVNAKCVMRGECYEVGGFAKICPVDEEASSLFDGLDEEEMEQTLAIVRRRCPHILLDDEGNEKEFRDVMTCCDHKQLEKMADNLLMADGVLGRCPSCVRNFARQICEMNCSPDQDRFVEVVRIEYGTNDTAYVNEANYRVHEDFMLGAYTACSGVLVPQTGLPAINMMCGNAPVCDAQAWFSFTGDTATNPLAPVQINFLKTTTEYNSMNAPILPCNESYLDDVPCSCIDCMAQCPVGNEPIIPERCTVLSVDCIAFSVGLVFLILSIAIFAFMAVSRSDIKVTDSKQNEKVIRPNIMTRLFESVFSHIGSMASTHHLLMIMITTWIVFGMSFGVMNLKISSKPLELWSEPESRSRHELEYFNSRFGPFYRAAQVFLTINKEPFEVDGNIYGPAFRFEAIEELVSLENEILNIGRDTGGVTLEQVCYAPLRVRGGEQRLDQCVSMSAVTYLGGQLNNETYLNSIQNCLNNFYSFDCLASWGGGAEPEITFGGYEDNVYDANTLLINFPIANHLLEENLAPVLEWELRLIELLQEYEMNRKPDFIDLAYGAERSIEDEIERVSVAEAVPIAISYVLMFAYVTVALGNVRNCKTWLIDSKVTVAVGSILVVVAAVFCGMGVMGYAQVTLTLLAINVIPFFVLSVGIDNVFLMVNTLHDIENNLKSYSDYNENFSFNRKRKFIFMKMMGKVGPSIFVTAITQITCFAIGTLTNFPAVRSFAIFATFSMGFLFIFQITTVIAILSMNYKRESQNRIDIVCCIQKKILNDDDPLHSEAPYESITKRLMEPYAKFLLRWRVKFIVAVLFMVMVFCSVLMIPGLEVGLDQELALPRDSYVYKYLQAVNNLMKIGPPVFFIVKGGLNYSNVDHQNVICGGQLCHEDSLATQIFLSVQHSDITYMAKSSNSWLDDFFDWSGLYGACCKYNTTDGSFCSSVDLSPECQYCQIERNEWANGLRPGHEAFNRYIPFFLNDAPTEICNKGGLASYFNNVIYVLDSEGHATVLDSNFMAFHSTLVTSQDYISAVYYGYEISENITKAIKNHTGLDIEVFPYSVFYVYYEQYLTMWRDAFMSLGFCILGAFVFNLLASGFNFLTTICVIFTTVLILLNLMGVMYIWNIPLNAVSLINLIVAIAIGVEFCSHIGHAFATSNAPRSDRVEDAIKKVGSTIITGITFTNIPVIVLAFSYTEIIEVFFFRMFFSLVILGFIHGMIFFPVLLSYANNLTQSNKKKPITPNVQEPIAKQTECEDPDVEVKHL
ncbi:NPC intracellular cholesterol transporter 1 homolog 1b-like [Achroia grisella]|uniref:NPC intracellular cholesterol transporter 1 homolog 1b-like n=1 Tax=Achroia grisella TaxID=688607 RepID=UPI0027D25E84|nr:NPC intracellular cholesterol transporter 1 homolog 1b-like [Achroia grisella]